MYTKSFIETKWRSMQCTNLHSARSPIITLVIIRSLFTTDSSPDPKLHRNVRSRLSRFHWGRAAAKFRLLRRVRFICSVNVRLAELVTSAPGPSKLLKIQPPHFAPPSPSTWWKKMVIACISMHILKFSHPDPVWPGSERISEKSALSSCCW
jgi:hypothetical protein